MLSPKLEFKQITGSNHTLGYTFSAFIFYAVIINKFLIIKEIRPFCQIPKSVLSRTGHACKLEKRNWLFIGANDQ